MTWETQIARATTIMKNVNSTGEIAAILRRPNTQAYVVTVNAKTLRRLFTVKWYQAETTGLPGNSVKD